MPDSPSFPAAQQLPKHELESPESHRWNPFAPKPGTAEHERRASLRASMRASLREDGPAPAARDPNRASWNPFSKPEENPEDEPAAASRRASRPVCLKSKRTVPFFCARRDACFVI